MPWHLRNCIIFDGQFCGLATNGGSVFYRSNNAFATGLWIEEGATAITHLPEIEQNRLGFALGKQWIIENPTDFLKLSIRKLAHLLGDDSHGAYWGILRGVGGSHDQAMSLASPTRMFLYHSAVFVSWIFWGTVASGAIRALLLFGKHRCRDGEYILPLIYPLMYSAVVFSVFESGSRQHMAALAALIILAASSTDRTPIDARVAENRL